MRFHFRELFPRISIVVFVILQKLNDSKDKMISLRNRSSRSVIQALVLFLSKLRTGNSNKIISSVIKSFETDILPFHLGLSALTKDDLINNHTTLCI